MPHAATPPASSVAPANAAPHDGIVVPVSTPAGPFPGTAGVSRFRGGMAVAASPSVEDARFQKTSHRQGGPEGATDDSSAEQAPPMPAPPSRIAATPVPPIAPPARA